MDISNIKLIYSIKDLSILCGISMNTVHARIKRLDLKPDFIEKNLLYFKRKNIDDILNYKQAIIRKKLESTYTEVQSGLTVYNSKMNFLPLD